MSMEDKKCDKGETPKKKQHAASEKTIMEAECISRLISASPTEVSINHPNFQHLMVVNTSAVSALASRGRLVGPWLRLGLAPALSVEPLPMVALRGACRDS